MHVEIHDVLSLLTWAQAHPNGCVYYDWRASVEGASHAAMDHPQCAYEFAVGGFEVVWPVECYPGISHAEEALLDVVGVTCSECMKLLYPERDDELP